MEDNNTRIKKNIQEKMDIYFDNEITSSSYRAEQEKEKIQMRKNKINKILFYNKKQILKNDNTNIVNDQRKIDINKLNCKEEIKRDVKNYIRTQFDIKNWFKYFFSSNKNDIQLSLFLIQKFIELQIIEIKDIDRKLSRNNLELIQRLCDNLLNDDLKISYNSCACLTNLVSFPKNIENLIYSERNLEKILKFFGIYSNNVSLFGYEPLFLFFNICFNDDVKIYFIKNSFLEYFYNFINKILNHNNTNLDEQIEFNIINNSINILSMIISVCDVDDNYINKFVQFIPICKIITSKYYAHTNNYILNEESVCSLICIWNYYSKKRNNNKIFINEIIKDNFLKQLIEIYEKLNVLKKEIKIKISMIELFKNFLIIEDQIDRILINDGIIDFFSSQIKKYQYSNTEILNNIILSCSYLAQGNIGQVENLWDSGIISKIIDITKFYIDDNLDNEIKNILINSILCLAYIINNDKIRKKILIYDEFIIIKIFCKSLKIDLDPYNKNKLVQNIIYGINDLNVASEELDPELEQEYDYLLINISLEEILNNYYEKKYLENTCKEMIDDIKIFIKDLEKKNL